MPATTEPSAPRIPRLAVYKFSSCDGCQLSLLNLEEHLLELVGAVEVAYFLEARRRVLPPPYDIGLIEGSVSTPHEEERVRQIRKDCKFLVAIGACATSGGIQALRNWADVQEFARCVYPNPEFLKTLETATPIAGHAFVDFELRGCPVNPLQLLELITALLTRRRPNIPTHSLCIECKRLGHTCVITAQGQPCLGPITQAGCGALCPGCRRGCYGCFGPMEQPNIPALAGHFMHRQGKTPRDIKLLLRSFNGYLEPFKQASDNYERLEHK